jgi:hypothetical protein
MTRPPVNLSPLQKDYAVYLPAISCFYSTYVSKQRFSEFVPKERIPQGFDRGIEGMNFLNPEQGYFSYKYGLYSAGHAQLDLDKTMIQDAMIQDRDRANTVIVGDSGGYQIGKGVLKFDWLNFEGASANKTRDNILNWLELTADWSMLLDVPTWASDHIHSPKTGLTSFQDCLDKTLHNNDYFIRNRLGQTKFLNVLQGSDWDTAQTWYDAVKHLPTEGWAMGGKNMCDMEVALRRIIILRDEKLLDDRNWMHFLGTAQLDWSCYLTAIQRQVREHINEDFTISFDCASPFIATAHGLVYTNAQHTNKRWSVIMDKAPDNKAISQNFNMPFPFESEFGRRLSQGDICWYKPGMLNKIGKEGATSWDSFAYALMMGHNTYCHIVAVQRANQLADIEAARFAPDWREWKKVKDSDKSDEYSEWVPRNILYFNRFVKELFQSETPMQMLDDAKPMLNSMMGMRLRGGNANNTFNKHFETEEVVLDKSVSSVSAMPVLDEDLLEELEHEFLEQSSKQM